MPAMGRFRPTGKSVHSGFSFDSGHFEARIPMANRWIRVSDQHISELDHGPADNAEAQSTILMFEKHQPDGTPYQGDRHQPRPPRPEQAGAAAQPQRPRPQRPAETKAAAPRPRDNSGGGTPPSVITTPKADIPRKQRAKAGREQPTDFKHWKVLQQNVGGAFNAKGLVLTQSAEKFDIICVQEVGEVGEVPSQQPFPGYVTFVASTGRAQDAGVAILIKQELACYVRGEPYRDAGGRLICITLKGFSKAPTNTLDRERLYAHGAGHHGHTLTRTRGGQTTPPADPRKSGPAQPGHCGRRL